MTNLYLTELEIGSQAYQDAVKVVCNNMAFDDFAAHEDPFADVNCDHVVGAMSIADRSVMAAMGVRTVDQQGVLRVEYLATDVLYGGEGLAGRLLNVAEKIAHLKGLTRLQLESLPDAYTFYEDLDSLI